jgi:hypothetical protein
MVGSCKHGNENSSSVNSIFLNMKWTFSFSRKALPHEAS